MKAGTLILVLLLPVVAVAQTPTIPTAPAPAPAQDLRRLLQDGLFEEEANRNLEKASAAYEALLEKFAQDRQYAATAVFRLAEIRVKQNRKDDAIALFQRVVTEFGHDPLAQLSRERIAALGGTAPAPGGIPTSDKEADEIARLQDLVKNSPDLLNAQDDEKWTPLGRAAWEGWLKAATFLLDNGADLGGRFGKPPLHFAAHAGRKSMVELLLARGADPNLKDAEQRTALLEAVTHKRTEVVRLLLEKGARPNERAGSSHGPLHEACARGDLVLTRMLLDKGAEVNVVVGERMTAAQIDEAEMRFGTPLTLAVQSRRLEVVKLLLERGADANLATPHGNTALGMALGVFRPKPLTVQRAISPDRAMAALLLEHRADANAPGVVKASVFNNDVELLRLLVKHGANLDMKDSATGWPPLGVAIADPGSGVSKATLEALLELGASPNAATNQGEAPLHSVIGLFSVLSVANPSDARLNPPGGFKDRAQEIAKLLVARGADLNARTAEGQTVLHRAMASTNVPLEFVEWLLAKGADPTVKEDKGRTPAQVAPIERRLWLEERTVFPPLMKLRAIHGFIYFSERANTEPYRLEPVAEFDTPPTLDEFVRGMTASEKSMAQNTQAPLEVMVYRTDEQGGVKRVARVRVGTSAQKLELPALAWGDIVVAGVFKDPSSVRGVGIASLDALKQWYVFPETAPVRKVTVRLGDRQQEFSMCGRYAALWAPATEPLPDWNFFELVWRVVASEPRAELGAVKVQRDVNGKTAEWTVDVRPDKPGTTVKYIPARLGDGDRVVIPLRPANDPGALAARKKGVFWAAPGRIFGEAVFQLSEKDNAPRTLGELMMEAYLRSQMVIPDPDLAQIRIHRLKGDSGEEEIMDVNLAPAVEQITAETPEGAIRKLDVPLRPGDVVEIAPRKVPDYEHWTGLSGPMKLFLGRALKREVPLTGIPGGEQNYVLVPTFTGYERFASEAGLRWKRNPSDAQASPFRGLGVVNLQNALRVRLTSGERVREFSAEEFKAVNPWLINGDRLVVERF